MKVKLSSNNYDIIATGIAFIYDDNFTITLYDDNDTKDITVVIELIKDENCKKQAIKSSIIDNELYLQCINFLDKDDKSGIIKPVCIAESDLGKKMYLMFWIQREGSAGCIRTNTIKYTIFKEK